MSPHVGFPIRILDLVLSVSSVDMKRTINFLWDRLRLLLIICTIFPWSGSLHVSFFLSSIALKFIYLVMLGLRTHRLLYVDQIPLTSLEVCLILFILNMEYARSS